MSEFEELGIISKLEKIVKDVEEIKSILKQGKPKYVEGELFKDEDFQ